MEKTLCYIIRFDGIEPADAGRSAESLKQALQDTTFDIKARRIRTDLDAMDFGTALEIALAAPAIVELARGISDWLRRSHSSKVTIIGPDGSTIVENLRTRDAADLAEKLRTQSGG